VKLGRTEHFFEGRFEFLRRNSPALPAFLAVCVVSVVFYFLMGGDSLDNRNRTDKLESAGVVLQRGDYDCGAAALATVMLCFGDSAGATRARDMFWPSTAPISMLELRNAARKSGYRAFGLKCGEEAFLHLDGPRLVLIRGDHWVVVESVDGPKLTILDPARGRYEMKNNVFFRVWSGYVLVVRPFTRAGPAAGKIGRPNRRDFHA
jgi:predicted double-glycine peptidase